jgi:hypothetical protein
MRLFCGLAVQHVGRREFTFVAERWAPLPGRDCKASSSRAAAGVFGVMTVISRVAPPALAVAVERTGRGGAQPAQGARPPDDRRDLGRRARQRLEPRGRRPVFAFDSQPHRHGVAGVADPKAAGRRGAHVVQARHHLRCVGRAATLKVSVGQIVYRMQLLACVPLRAGGSNLGDLLALAFGDLHRLSSPE